MRREFVPAADVEREWAAVLRQVRSGVLALTSRIRGRLPHLTTTDAKVIDGEIREALTSLGTGQTT